jgi:hypothetical protein
VTDGKGERYLLYTLSGAPREAFARFGLPRNTAIFQPTFGGTGIVRCDDIRTDPRYGKSGPHFGMPKGHLPVVSYLAVPVISQSGEVHGGLFFGHDKPAAFSKGGGRDRQGGGNACGEAPSTMRACCKRPAAKLPNAAERRSAIGAKPKRS